jgi:hypothetical protein
MYWVEFFFRLFKYGNALFFALIFIDIFLNLAHHKQLLTNHLGLGKAAIFLTVSLSNLLPAIFRPITNPLDLFIFQIIFDFWMCIAAIYYIVQRQKYRVLIDRPEATDEFLAVMAQQAEQLQIWAELESKLSPELLELLLKEKPYRQRTTDTDELT